MLQECGLHIKRRGKGGTCSTEIAAIMLREHFNSSSDADQDRTLKLPNTRRFQREKKFWSLTIFFNMSCYCEIVHWFRNVHFTIYQESKV